LGRSASAAVLIKSISPTEAWRSMQTLASAARCRSHCKKNGVYGWSHIPVRLVVCTPLGASGAFACSSSFDLDRTGRGPARCDWFSSACSMGLLGSRNRCGVHSLPRLFRFGRHRTSPGRLAPKR
jgi:hypothetical protein